MDILIDVTNSRLRGMIDLCHAEIPAFALKFKDQSSFMKGLNVFAKIFNKDFMTRYTTTVGATVYFPSQEYLLGAQNEAAMILAHELVHMKEEAKQGSILYTLRYFFPQILVVLSLLAVLAVWSPWFLLALVFLLCLAPLPSPGRRDIELNGYTMSLAVIYWQSTQLLERDFARAAAQFTGSAYWFMWPFKASILNDLKMKGIEIRTGRVLNNPLFRKVYTVMVKQP